jgi:hypothetical protein
LEDSAPSSTSSSPADRKKRSEIAIGITGASGMLGAILVSGWFGGPVRAVVALIVAAVGGLVAGIVAGTSRDERAHAAGSAVLAAVGITFAVSAYISDRSSVYNLELLLPAAIGSLPGLLAYFGLKRLVPGPRTRALVGLGLGAAAVAVALAAAPKAAAPSAEEDETEAPTLDNQLGDKSAQFFSAVARIEAIVSIYGPGGLAKAGASGQKLLGELDSGLTSMRAEADRRIVAGEPAKSFATLDAVERRVRVFLRENGVMPAK